MEDGPRTEDEHPTERRVLASMIERPVQLATPQSTVSEGLWSVFGRLVGW